MYPRGAKLHAFCFTVSSFNLTSSVFSVFVQNTIGPWLPLSLCPVWATILLCSPPVSAPTTAIGTWFWQRLWRWRSRWRWWRKWTYPVSALTTATTTAAENQVSFTDPHQVLSDCFQVLSHLCRTILHVYGSPNVTMMILITPMMTMMIMMITIMTEILIMTMKTVRSSFINCSANFGAALSWQTALILLSSQTAQ